MNDKLTTIGFYATCLIFFAFQTQSNLPTSTGAHANTNLPTPLTEAVRKINTHSIEQSPIGKAQFKNIKSICKQPINNVAIKQIR
ncbi:MAG: hypothetical protein WCG67_00560 [Ferruginibacter sp.]